MGGNSPLPGGMRHHAPAIEANRPAAGSVAGRFHGGIVCELGFSGDADRIR